MPSPFPGVDPFIEDQYYWPDFHHRFMTYLCDTIADHLPEKYEARLEERIRFIECEERPKKTVREPDVTVERRKAGKIKAIAATSILKPTIEPVVIELPPVEEHREVRMQILHRPGRQLVTVLEVLSSDNKRGSGRD